MFIKFVIVCYNFQGGIFAPVATREGAVLETEGWGSKTLSIKENIHNIVAGIFQVNIVTFFLQ